MDSRGRLVVAMVVVGLGCAGRGATSAPSGGAPDDDAGAGPGLGPDAAADSGRLLPVDAAPADAPASPTLDAVLRIDTAAISAPARDREITAAVAAVDASHLMASIGALTAQTTRNTCSDQSASGRGIGGAREWIRGQLQGLGGLTVSLDAFSYAGCAGGAVTAQNVVAVKPGRHPERVIVVGGHYDSRTFGVADGQSPAPGANDSGSQTALVLEAARLMSPLALDATVMFVAFAGEEQGLVGSAHLAKSFGQYVAPNAKIEAVLNMDIVGGDSSANDTSSLQQFRVYSPGTPREFMTPMGTTDDESPSRGLMRYIGACVAIYVPEMTMVPELREDRPGRGGDQESFISAAFPAVRFIETRESPNAGQPGSHQHSPDDRAMYVTPAYAARMGRVVVATALDLARAPQAPAISGVTGSGPWQLGWTAPASGPPVDHYVIAARPATENLYSTRVVTATGTARSLSPDELGVAADTPFYLSIAAVDADGHPSLFAYPEYRCEGGACVVPADALDVTARK